MKREYLALFRLALEEREKQKAGKITFKESN
jgi:hypothetical protein